MVRGAFMSEVQKIGESFIDEITKVAITSEALAAILGATLARKGRIHWAGGAAGGALAMRGIHHTLGKKDKRKKK